ncbi:ATP-binding cassette domain-containing protein [Streptomyces sp. VRA16 Mangrove soil]|uniref:ABC transporter ATP-binding protein n=1 Tax=Streptomyces sp. VRA16 Mangrove soil TaxID=2817434 RepID=UPI001A9E1FC8|nr:ATP-binding cassette domain-containing protein [Streptomyces sp. VRA16 Mangrove soil]MBO1335553.1 ATP-binding cassette domain-containing protein [Streptomyces sp. VRA16 Mangrove soil]
MRTASLIALERVGRRYGLGGPWVLRDIDLTVPPGALIRVRGANGSGKSTLLRIVAGIDAPGRGRVVGRPRTAYVPERFPAALPCTALGYLTHLGRVHGLARAEAARRAGEWMERFGADAYANTPLAELSKGSSQKVAVAQALLAAPELLVLDEAWTGLDSAARAELDRAVAERTAAGGAVVFVDHDPRRLAGSVDAVHAVEGTSLVTVSDGDGSSGPYDEVVIEARGAGEPPELPRPHTLSRVDARTVRVAAPVTHSDLVLRTLLNARPPWHITAVREPVGSPAENPVENPVESR